MTICLLLAAGCASTFEEVNRGAREAGKPAGGVMRVPLSVSEGVSDGLAGQSQQNPYGR